MVISFFIMLNALLAIIVDAYTQVAELHKSKDPLPCPGIAGVFKWPKHFSQYTVFFCMTSLHVTVGA
jgi:hypothetical protein